MSTDPSSSSSSSTGGIVRPSDNGLLSYGAYLQLDTLLSCQKPESERVHGKLSHDEMLFITIHQSEFKTKQNYTQPLPSTTVVFCWFCLLVCYFTTSKIYDIPLVLLFFITPPFFFDDILLSIRAMVQANPLWVGRCSPNIFRAGKLFILSWWKTKHSCCFNITWN